MYNPNDNNNNTATHDDSPDETQALLGQEAFQRAKPTLAITTNTIPGTAKSIDIPTHNDGMPFETLVAQVLLGS
jgi:hypothetical protein